MPVKCIIATSVPKQFGVMCRGSGECLVSTLSRHSVEGPSSTLFGRSSALPPSSKQPPDNDDGDANRCNEANEIQLIWPSLR